MASGWFSLVLAMEIAFTRRPSAIASRVPPPYPANKQREWVRRGSTESRSNWALKWLSRPSLKYMIKEHGPPNQGWLTFLRNHSPDIAAMDLFTVPTVGFKLLYGFIIVRLHRRNLVWINVTANPTAEWIARQITETFPREDAPRYVVRNRDGVYGATVARLASGMVPCSAIRERIIGG
jgi:hypothetical protein